MSRDIPCELCPDGRHCHPDFSRVASELAAIVEWMAKKGDSAPKLLIINGCSGVGKSTAAKYLLKQKASTARIAVLERDDFADAAGRLHLKAKTSRAKLSWEISTPAMAAATKVYLQNGFNVVLPLAHSKTDAGFVKRYFGRFEPLHVLVQPSWATNKRRRQKRIDFNSTQGIDELAMYSWAEHRKLHDELEQMSDEGYFDYEIDNTGMSTKELAANLAEILGIA